MIKIIISIGRSEIFAVFLYSNYVYYLEYIAFYLFTFCKGCQLKCILFNTIGTLYFLNVALIINILLIFNLLLIYYY